MTTFIKGTYSRSIYESSAGYHVGILRVLDTNDENLNEYVGRTSVVRGDLETERVLKGFEILPFFSTNSICAFAI